MLFFSAIGVAVVVLIATAVTSYYMMRWSQKHLGDPIDGLFMAIGFIVLLVLLLVDL